MIEVFEEHDLDQTRIRLATFSLVSHIQELSIWKNYWDWFSDDGVGYFACFNPEC